MGRVKRKKEEVLEREGRKSLYLIKGAKQVQKSRLLRGTVPQWC